MKTYLLSYPRSGNTWVRYIIEFLSKRPTKGYDNPDDIALGARTDIGVDLDSDLIAIKSHREIPNKSDLLVLVIRDYHEAVVRHAPGGLSSEQMIQHFVSRTSGYKRGSKTDYIGIIQDYDSFRGEKLLLYYEDLMTDPKPEVQKLIEFMGISDEHLSSFFDNYDEHKGSSIKSYQDKSFTNGTDLKFHSSKFNTDCIESMTQHLKDNHLDIYSKYLTRYSR